MARLRGLCAVGLVTYEESLGSVLQVHVLDYGKMLANSYRLGTRWMCENERRWFPRSNSHRMILDFDIIAYETLIPQICPIELSSYMTIPVLTLAVYLSLRLGLLNMMTVVEMPHIKLTVVFVNRI